MTQPYEQSPYAYPYRAVPRSSDKALTSLILGIVSIFFLGPLLGVPAMVLSVLAKREIDASNGWIVGRSKATAGFWTGLVGSTWLILLVLLVFTFGPYLPFGSA